MSAAEGVLGPVSEAEAPPASILQERFSALGHQMEQSGRVLFCSLCAAHTVPPGGNLRGLSAKGNGRYEHPSTKSSQALKIRYAAQGLRPRTGKVLDPV